MEHDEQANRLERQAERLEHDSDKVERDIDEARRDWAAKERDPAVPGAQPERADDEQAIPGVETDPERVSEQGGP